MLLEPISLCRAIRVFAASVHDSLKVVERLKDGKSPSVLPVTFSFVSGGIQILLVSLKVAKEKKKHE